MLCFGILLSGQAPSVRFGVESDTVSSLGRGLHDVGLAAIVGGNLFARVGMHPAVAEIDDPRERGKVVNAAWRRYGTVNSLGLGALIAGWGGARLSEARPSMLSERERQLAAAKDVAVGIVAVTGVAAGLEGMRFGSMEPEGAVPLDDGDTASSAASAKQQRSKRLLSAVGACHLGAALALIGINAALGQANFRRPPVRRVLRRNY
jgi:uncharacterized membrane protein